MFYSLFYTWLSRFPSTTYWRDCFLSIVYSCPFCCRSIDHRCVGLFLGSLFYSVDLLIWFCVSIRAFWCLIWEIPPKLWGYKDIHLYYILNSRVLLFTFRINFCAHCEIWIPICISHVIAYSNALKYHLSYKSSPYTYIKMFYGSTLGSLFGQYVNYYILK